MIKSESKKINNIHIDYALSEFIDEFTFDYGENGKPLINLPINISELYRFSCKYIQNDKDHPIIKDINDILILDNNEPVLLDDGSDKIYFNRIKQAIENIKVRYPDKNILIVTHGDVVRSFLPMRPKGLVYGEVITDPIFPDEYSNKYLKIIKYIKYKKKYLQLKNKMRTTLN